MKIALLEVSHWHFPLYVEALLASDAEIVAISDRGSEIRDREAARFGCRAYDDPFHLIADESIDFAFAFGRHCDMPDIAAALIARGIPFAIEKPCGRNAGDVARLRRAAEAKKLFVAIPLVQRLGPLYALVDRLVSDEGAVFSSTSWRFLAGPPDRYLQIGCDWMLDPRLSGGGSMINLSVHFIDLALFLLGAPARTVFARTSTTLHDREVEDFAMLTFETANGGTAQIETGYCFPESPAKREYSFSLVSKSHFLQSGLAGVSVHRPGDDPPETIGFDLDTDPLYGAFVERTLSDFRQGRPPVANLSDLQSAMRVIDAGYRAAATGTSVPLVA